jgi:polysaccharide pyruvyl transferase CsaB
MAVVNKPVMKTRDQNEGAAPISSHRKYVVVSGYYGFDNLGDEAILEELTNELKKLIKPENIIVLSANPKRTAELFGVGAVERTDLFTIADLCKSSRLFISGGGGLFQNTRSIGSIVFYAFQIALARSLGAPVAIYAQGIGPLRGKMAEWITHKAFAAADAVLVRDNASKTILESWGVEGIQTADPVWCLDSRKLPKAVNDQIEAIKPAKLVGLSLRSSDNFSDAHLKTLVSSMLTAVPANAHVILLPLQINQDKQLLEQFADQWRQHGRAATLIDTSSLHYPSEWISLFSKCKLVIGMRLHALIMSLKAGIPVVGMAYDPKVSHLLAEFEQPSLILTIEPNSQEWEQTLQTAFADMEKLGRKATKKAEGAKKLACQNFNMLDRILNTQRYS